MCDGGGELHQAFDSGASVQLNFTPLPFRHATINARGNNNFVFLDTTNNQPSNNIS